MTVYRVDPVRDPRWSALLARHPRATVFHTPGWLEALQQTYGYEPAVLTTSPHAEPLANGLAVCTIRTWLGTRVVSLPFSDHCDPLADSPGTIAEIAAHVREGAAEARWTSVELRPRHADVAPPAGAGFAAAATFTFHALDLTPPLGEIHARFHHSCVQRAIRRAERESLTYDVGSADDLIERFYRLLLMTRRRHGLPPQPVAWFRALAAGFGEAFAIHMVSRDGQPLAALLILRFKETAIFKYGVSDARFHQLGVVPLLFWRVIQDSRAAGATLLDMGRSDRDQAGLVTFKNRLGATPETLTYYRYPATAARESHATWRRHAAKRLVAILPDAALAAAGRIVYRYLG